MLDKQTFMNWLSEFTTNKANQLQYSYQNLPKRVEKITLDLSVAPTNPVPINLPFSSMTVSRIYSTAVTTTDKAGSISVMFDVDSIANIKNAVTLFVNDTLESDNEVSKCFLTWTAQSDTTVDLYFYPDIKVVAGTTKTQIVGSITVTNSTASPLNVVSAVTNPVYTKLPVPTSTTTLTCNGAGGSFTYTVGAGTYIKVNAVTASTGAGVSSSVSVGAAAICYSFTGAGGFASNNANGIILPAGTVLTGATGLGCYAWALVEVYSI